MRNLFKKHAGPALVFAGRTVKKNERPEGVKVPMKWTEVLDRIFKVLTMVLMILYAISLLVPLFWMLMSSFKANDEFLLYTFQFPKEFLFSNYGEVLRKFEYTVTKPGVGLVRYGLWDMFFYSVVWAVFTNLIPVFFRTLTSYLIGKYKFPGRDFIFGLGLILMILPIIGTGAAGLRIAKAINTYDNMLNRILICGSGAFYGFDFILLFGAWKGIPWEYAEASFIDGGGNFKTFLNVMFPMILPTSTVVFVLGFLGTWNDYMTFITWLPSYANLAVGMYMFQYNASLYMVGTPTILAGFTLIAIPTTILYLLSQKVIMAKLNVGGLKG